MSIEDGRRDAFARRVLGRNQDLLEASVALVQAGSENPSGDTVAVAAVVEDLLSNIPGMTVARVIGREPVVNLVAEMTFASAGRRLVLNGHLDTFPVGDPTGWSIGPLSGSVSGGRIHGRGIADMKAGIAAAIVTASLLADEAAELAGSLALVFAGDEETGGKWGTEYLLDHVPAARGDAMLSGEPGSPRVVRLGEKGHLWIELTATGVSNHGAHVHLGINAIDALLDAIDRVRGVRDLDVRIPAGIRTTLDEAREASEAGSGPGEQETLRTVTLNVGRIEGGGSINVIPDQARAQLDIRLPPGTDVARVAAFVDDAIRPLPNVRSRVISSSEPNVTDPGQELVRLTLANARERCGDMVASNLRVGMSDARFYRALGIPSVSYGPTPFNMGGPDEHVTIDDVEAVLFVHAMTAFDYLARGRPADH